jgi:hypothetical protein
MAHCQIVPRRDGLERACSRQGGARTASKTAFTPEEWNRILESVMLSGMAVTAADPSGLFGVLKDVRAAKMTQPPTS